MDDPVERTLPMSADLPALFTELSPVYESDATLLTGRDAAKNWCVIVDDRPAQAPTLKAFPTESERGAWLGRVYVSALGIPEESAPGESEDLDEGGPSARVPVSVPPPTKPGGDERTFDESLAPPRNP